MPEPTRAPPATSPAPTSPLGLSESPAAQQLAALNKKEAKKEGKSSRLRRAFSFGSAAELRKASAENSANNARERNKLQKPQFADEEEAQQAAIAQQQEASGLGESIYSGQGHFFTGSTDNLSISSTASSASVMIRKMGKGVKKGSRSLVGLFRPKSVVGVPAADSAVPEPSVAQVSMVTVEAEREKVNVNVNPHDQPGGGTGFPKLERNSMEATTMTQEAAHSLTDDSVSRRSIVGGERERAEVLATIKKGILKRKMVSLYFDLADTCKALALTLEIHLPNHDLSIQDPTPISIFHRFLESMTLLTLVHLAPRLMSILHEGRASLILSKLKEKSISSIYSTMPTAPAQACPQRQEARSTEIFRSAHA